ncbi:5-(carboxyamino)imidazole ribonucleotide synthase [Phormidesmis priestleyi ULC007]|uniref:N5-carboxyaminoimidazole ribonucleotide synthase n=1 Tax=Phormidesmis priestleyi ULC007 TaxID=1920490 RepID=A0A2T1DF51_9CYAN|nr:5-(carboxyamino)imidazole ribonucleotide synthase [Phormidesmis priestleyi]PSB19085.1 5-(carboxyamino)imidazole ribonucleotide synthase [Phormidesmis priestleyi ULC007]PZO46055.1 MAG: 5-(carboxyamino)imidazole ribonucleotide synthase [Phormidesmis priestleyi]
MKRVGVIGGGQLAWMMADAVKKLDVELIIQTPSPTDPAVSIATQTIFAAIDDADSTAHLAARCDVITFENEFVDLDALFKLEKQGVCFRPSLDALKPLLDKYDQRCYLRDRQLPTPNFFALETGSLLQTTEFPIVLKTRRHGYDGQGTFILKTAEELEAILKTLNDQPLLVEEFVPFDRELAVMAARSLTGEIVVYPVVETQQEDQVCRRVVAPADLPLSIVREVETIAHTLLDNLQFVGIFGIELFLTPEGKILVNEIAPRTHNSGHYTIDACVTSQFEQQLRAVCGLSLGSPALTCEGAVMINLLGYEQSESDYLDKRQQLAEIPGAVVHWYGKTESRLGRKLGHVTVLLESASDLRQRAIEIGHTIESIWYRT